jgi:hypothetical protein
MTLRKIFTGLLCILILLVSASCSNSKNVGNLQPEDERIITGISVGSFEITRFNAAGFEDASLNSSLDAAVKQVGDEYALTVNISEGDVDRTLALSVEFDGANMHYARTEFHGLLGSSDNVLEASFGLMDSVQLGQTAIGDYDPGSVDGSFATLYFAPGASRSTSGVIGNVYQSATGVAVTRTGSSINFVGDQTVGDEKLYFTNGWMMADGDQNGLCTVSDITPIGVYLGQVCATNPVATRADYDNNGLVTISELTPLGVHLGEGVTSYRVGLRDDGSGTTTLASEKTLTVADISPVPDPGGASLSDLRTIFRSFDMLTLFTPGEITAADANATNGVEVCVIPVHTNATPAGVLAFVPWGGTPPVESDEITINNFDIQVTGVSGGNGDIFDSTISGGSAVANSEVGFQLNAIVGTFNGVDFTSDPGSFPEGMTQAHYDAAADAVRNSANWTFATAGAAGLRSTALWVHDGTPAANDIGGQGDPGTGTVFPDYDPESDEFSPEGTLNVFLGNTQSLSTGTIGSTNYVVKVLSDRDYNWTFDVTRDPNQPEFGEILKIGLEPMDVYALVVGTRAYFRDVDWGDPGVPGTFNSIEMEIWKANGGPSPNCELVNDFTFVAGDPGTGEFSIREDETPGTYIFEYVVNGAQLQGSSQYVVRFFNGVEWSSINMPENKTIPSGPAPPAADLTSIPNAGGYKGMETTTILQILYPDPVMRRWSDVFANPLTDSVEIQKGPAPDFVDKTQAFNDILRTDGDEFAIFTTPQDSPQGFSIWPQVLIKNLTATGASDVEVTDIPLATPSGPVYWTADGTGVILVQHGLGRIVVDIAAVPKKDGDFGSVAYAFGLYTPQGTDFLPVGTGKFTMNPFSTTTKPNAIDWGIDAFDREARDLDNGNYSNHIINGNFVNDPVQPFVLWVEFNGGNVFDWNQNEAGVHKVNTNLDNIYIRVIDVDQPSDERIMEVGLRLIGVTPTGNFLGIHTITNKDFVKFGAPPSETWGILQPSHKYEVRIWDRVEGGNTFGVAPADLLTVIGNNPNS